MQFKQKVLFALGQLEAIPELKELSLQNRHRAWLYCNRFVYKNKLLILANAFYLFPLTAYLVFLFGPQNNWFVTHPKATVWIVSSFLLIYFCALHYKIKLMRPYLSQYVRMFRSMNGNNSDFDLLNNFYISGHHFSLDHYIGWLKQQNIYQLELFVQNGVNRYPPVYGDLLAFKISASVSEELEGIKASLYDLLGSNIDLPQVSWHLPIYYFIDSELEDLLPRASLDRNKQLSFKIKTYISSFIELNRQLETLKFSFNHLVVNDAGIICASLIPKDEESAKIVANLFLFIEKEYQKNLNFVPQIPIAILNDASSCDREKIKEVLLELSNKHFELQINIDDLAYLRFYKMKEFYE